MTPFMTRSALRAMGRKATILVVVSATLALRGVAQSMVGWQLSVNGFWHTIGQEGPVAYYAGWVVLTPLIFLLARRVPFRRDRWVATAAFHFVSSIAVTAATRLLFTNLGAVYLGRVRWADMPSPLSQVWTEYLVYCVLADTSVYWLILAGAFAFAIWDEDHARQRRATDLERALVAAQVDALRMRLQPHFLFNTLNSISFLAVEKDTDGVALMVQRLSSLLRSSMQSGGRQLVTVGEELALLDQYLAIEEIRFADRLQVVRQVPASVREALIPSLVLQPMVENSIKHGLSRRLDAGRLEVAVTRDHDALVVSVQDDGPGVPPGWDLATHCGRGLKNVIERLEKIYPNGWSFTLRNQPDGGAIARLRIPWQSGPAVGAARTAGVGILAPAGR